MGVREDLAKRYQCPVWQSRDNTYVPLVLMGDRHLDNLWHWLHRHLAECQRRIEILETMTLGTAVRIVAADFADGWALGEDALIHHLQERAGTQRWIEALEQEYKRRGRETDGERENQHAGDANHRIRDWRWALDGQRPPVHTE